VCAGAAGPADGLLLRFAKLKLAVDHFSGFPCSGEVLLVVIVIVSGRQVDSSSARREDSGVRRSSPFCGGGAPGDVDAAELFGEPRPAHGGGRTALVTASFRAFPAFAPHVRPAPAAALRRFGGPQQFA
jgi:hypothetical protein